MIEESSVSAAESNEAGGNQDDQSPESDAHGEDSLPKDVIFGLLSAERRRRVLEYMVEHGEQTTLSDLADHIAALENDTEIRLLSSQQRKRVYVALYQCHLPKMDDADVIEFNQPRGTVERRPNADQLYPYLAVDPIASDVDDSSGSDGEVGFRKRFVGVLS